MQSRQQVETLQQALSEAKRDGVIQNAASSARAEAAAALAAKAAKEKARAELMAQLEAADADERPHGFADTQPLAAAVNTGLGGSDQHALDAAGVGARHVVFQPARAQQPARHLDHDVVGLQQAALQVVLVARQPLQATRA